MSSSHDAIEAPNLGPVVHVFDRGQRGWWLALQIAVLAVALSLLAMGGVALVDWDDPAPGIVLVTRVSLGVGGVLFVIGAWLVPRSARARGAGVRVQLHEGGLLVKRDRVHEEVAWADVLGVREQLERRESTAWGRRLYPWVGYVTAGRGAIRVDQVAGPALLGIVETQARPHVWRRMIAAFERGERFAFGAVVADRDGVTIGAERLPWAQVQLMTEEEHRLRIHTDRGDTVVDRFAVSFRTVLAILLEEMWTHEGDVDAIARTLPTPPPPVYTRTDLPAARLIA